MKTHSLKEEAIRTLPGILPARDYITPYFDVALILLFFFSTFAISFAHLQKVGLGFTYQTAFSPALIWACTGKFESLPYAIDTQAHPELAAVDEFIRGKRQSFNCGDLPPSPVGRGPFYDLEYATPYLIAPAAALWSLVGVKWSALFWLAALFAGATSVAVYGVCRLFLSRTWACAATVLAITSPVNVQMIPELRDYAKAPFLLGVIFLCGWLVKSIERPRQFVAVAALAGLVGGIGFGVRTDLALALPFFGFVVFAILVSSRLRLYRQCFFAVAVFLLVFFCAALPVLSVYRSGGNIAHVILLGLTTPFDSSLGVSPQPYEVGHIYNDWAMFQFVKDFFLGQQAGAGPRPEFFWGSPTHQIYALRALIAFVLHFPADIVVRAYSAALETLALNFGVSGVSITPDWFNALRSSLISQAAAPFLFLFALIFVGCRRPRMAAFLLAAFVYFGCTGALQFQYRHVFYLEFFYWLSLACAVAALVTALRQSLTLYDGSASLRKHARGLVGAIALPVGTIALGILLLVALRAYQSPNEIHLAEKYLAAPQVTVSLFEQPASGNMTLLRPTGALPAMSGVTAPIDTASNAFYFDAVVDGTRCPFFAAKVLYDSEYVTQAVQLVSSEGGKGHIFFPVTSQAGPYLHFRFKGILVDAEQRPCLLGLRAITDYKSLPLPLWWELPANWRELSSYQARNSSLLPFTFDSEPRVVTAGSLPSVTYRQVAGFKIHSFGEKAWEGVYKPAVARGPSIRIEGVPQSSGAYATKSVPYHLSGDTAIAARGRVNRGGILVGLLNAEGNRWEIQLPIAHTGKFFALLKAPKPGVYRVVVANNLRKSEKYNDAEIADIGLIGVNPSDLRVTPE